MGRDLVSLLLPIPQDNRARRFAQLYSGLLTYGFSTALMVRADLGLNPWDVFHQGAAAASGLTIGAATIGTAVIVLTFWIPIRQRPGLGTISNVVVIGMAVDVSLALLPTPGLLLERSVYLTAGIALNAVATGMYIGAGMGPGPRDGLMTGLERILGPCRTDIDRAKRPACRLVPGGTVGLGSAAYAIAIGPLVHVLIPALSVSEGRVEEEAQLDLRSDS